MWTLMDRLAGRRETPWVVAALGAAAAMVYGFWFYHHLTGPLDMIFDADHFGKLGMGLWQQGTLAFHPDTQPTIQRGPLYPAFLAGLLALSQGWYPQVVFLAQSLLLGGISLAVWAMGRRLFTPRVALGAALVCALHPFLIWYTAKIWVENMQTLLFTLVLLAMVRLAQRPGLGRALLLGLCLGLSCLTKAVVLPFVLLIPAGLALLKPVRVRPGLALAVAVTALLVVAPWTLRNYALTGQLIPVHGLGGFNMVAGDEFARHWREAPLSYRHLFFERVIPRLDAIKTRIPTDQPLWAQHRQLDQEAMAQSLETYQREPLFLLKKVLVNAYMFWVLGFTPLNTLALCALQLPLLVLFLWGGARLARRWGVRSLPVLLVGVVGVYYVLHLPIFAFARLSNVLTPVMVLVAWAGFWPQPPQAPGESSPEA